MEKHMGLKIVNSPFLKMEEPKKAKKSKKKKVK